MDFLTGVYLGYSFLAFYYIILFTLIYLQNRKDILKVPKITKKYSVSCVIPCYNEEENIGKTIDSIAKNGYKNLKKIIVVDDRSTDNSYEIMKKYEKKYPGLVIAVQTPKNTGKAAGAKNYGSKFVETELIVFTDADSFPEKGAIEKMVGFFDAENTGAVTSSVLVKNRSNFLLRMQALEYMVIKFTRKLLEYVDSIYVTPGPLAMYRAKYFFNVGGFDEKNLTEDIEITWRFLDAGYDVKMSLPSRVYSVAPRRAKEWIKQRIRWNVGGIQSIIKHKNKFFRKGILGFFVLPFFIVSWIIGISGLAFFIYRAAREVILRYASTTYSVGANTAVLSLQDLSLNPDILFYFGMMLFAAGLIFTFLSIFYEKEKEFKRPRIFDVMVYMFFYLLVYPVIILTSLYKALKGEIKW
ncbi:MAG: glycosyltransferase family 2 protein [Nanoarchaeota archaeon]|nr:glycosyltransferase family 2 protein [Nanoarchaeota archaeon]